MLFIDNSATGQVRLMNLTKNDKKDLNQTTLI